MRIIGGKFKGRRIIPTTGFKARPTTDFAREGLFNVLNNRVDFETLEILDLFSGTGSISYEFASRGAVSVHLVEKDPRHIAGIKSILRKMSIDNIKPLHVDVKAYLKACSYKYDIVFADPPFDLKWLEELPDLITEVNILKKDGFLILEHPRRISFTHHPLFFEQRNYGGVNFSFFNSKPQD